MKLPKYGYEANPDNLTLLEYQDLPIMSGFQYSDSDTRILFRRGFGIYEDILSMAREEADEEGPAYEVRKYEGIVDLDQEPHRDVVNALSALVVSAAETIAFNDAYGVADQYDRLRELSDIVRDPGTGHVTLKQAYAEIDEALDIMPRRNASISE